MSQNNSDLILRFEVGKKKKGKYDAPVPVSVQFRNASAGPYKFTNPITDKELANIRWYVESYAGWFSEEQKDSAEDVEALLPQIGQRLFDAVFKASPEAMSIFRDFDNIRKQSGGNLVVDTNEPSILRLPWELLRDEGGYLFRKNPPISVHRRMRQTHQIDLKSFQPPVRILMIVSRPKDATFIDPRTIAVPFLDALDDLDEQVEVEFLRPPTLTALDERLHNRNLPPVHIVHFDGHGVYDQVIGLGFLIFEDDNFMSHRIDSDKLGNLLNESGIPLAVLNACQSAKPDERNPFASVATRLIESGIGGVVAMNYSVLVETAKLFAGDFYGELARGRSVASAIDSARRRLYSNSKRGQLRRSETEEIESVHLQDWFLPALYQQAEELIPFKPDGKSIAPASKSLIPLQSKGERGGFPPPPLHGFHGRARELLDLERAFATRSIVVLHGFGGQGKTSLATQAAEWFTRTRLFERAAFLSFENGASLEYVLNELGNALVEENFQIHAGDKVEAIAESLQEHPALVVFDNFESALPGGNAPMQELQALLDAAAKWFPANGGPKTGDRGSSTVHRPRSCLLITTRNPDIPHPDFTPGTTCLRRELEGLAPSDALELAASILEAHSLPRPPRVPLENLLTFLRGHPLSLQLALPQLRTYSAEELVAEYQTILPNIKTGAAKERNESLEVSLRFSLDRLGEEAKTLLSRLWVFEGGAWEPALLAVSEIPKDEWNSLKPQLTSTALVREESLPGIEGQPFIHFHPTLAPYLRTMDNGRQTVDDMVNGPSSIVQRYWQVYYSLARQLYQDDTQHPIQARAIVLRELPNLKRALKLALDAGALDEAVNFADSINRFLDNFGRWRERDEVASQVERTMEKERGKRKEGGGITKSEFLLESGRGERLLQGGRASEAEKIFRALLSRLEGDAEYDTRYDQAIVLAYLGRCLSTQGHPLQAADSYRRAIILAEKLEQTNNVKNQIAAYHGDLADVLADSGKYTEAQKEYETALASAKETGNDRHQGVFLGQLGTLALRQGDLNEARKRHLEALSLFQRMGEDRMEAMAWLNLGIVAYEKSESDEAEKCYKEAIPLYEKIGDYAYVASTCNNLAANSKKAGRLQEAERWYLRAIELGEKLNLVGELGKWYSNLANLYLSQNRLDEAETYARRALPIMETRDLSSKPWVTYGILAQIAEKRGKTDESRLWRRKEQESRMAFERQSGGQANTSRDIQDQVDKWNPVIANVVSTCRNGTEPSPELSHFLEEMAQTDDWRNLIAVIRRVMSGDRSVELFDGLDPVDSAIIRRILQALEGGAVDGGKQTVDRGPGTVEDGQAQPTSPQPSPQRRGGEEQGVTLPQLLELVERAAGGDQQLGGQLFSAFQQMARDENKEMSALGNVLLRVLIGEKNPSLDGLPDEVASMIRGLLGRLKNG